jgi:dolichol kinase
MFVDGIWRNVLLVVLCYAYVGVVIYVVGKIGQHGLFSQKSSRKFLHAMIGNLVFVMPFFTSNLYPVAVAAPFVFITFLATPYSPFKAASLKMKKLVAITEEGDRFGLVFYSVSYTILAVFFASRSYILGSGVLPMAYGDSMASIVGVKYGKRKYRVLADKSLEGSLAMLFVSLSSLIVGFVFFSAFYPLSVMRSVFFVVITPFVATVVEGLSPLGFDNLTVPLLCASIFFLLNGGF